MGLIVNIFFLILNLLGADVSIAGETKNQTIHRSVKQSQKAILEMPDVKNIKKYYENKITKYTGRETVAILSAFYFVATDKEISTKHIKNLSIPAKEWKVHPEATYHIDSQEIRYGMLFNRDF